MHLELICREPASQTHLTPLLFIHGSSHGAWCWDEFFLPFFAEHGYRACAIDLRGHGKSAGDYSRARLHDYVSDVVRVINEHQLSSPAPVLIGHSLGGAIVQKYLQDKNPLPSAVILMASVPPSGMMASSIRTILHSPSKILKSMDRVHFHTRTKSPEAVQKLFFSADMPMSTVLNFREKLVLQESFPIYLDTLTIGATWPVRARLSRGSRPPMLVMGGQSDRIIRPTDVRSTGRAYGAEVKILSGVAHDMMLDVRWNTVAESLLLWLQQQGL